MLRSHPGRADTGATGCPGVTPMRLPGFSAAEESSFVSRAQWAACVHLLTHSFLTQHRVTEPGAEPLDTTDPVLAAMKQESRTVYSVVDKSLGLASLSFLTYKLGLEQNLSHRRTESIK